MRPFAKEYKESSANELVDVRDDTDMLGEDETWLSVRADCSEGMSLSLGVGDQALVSSTGPGRWKLR